MEPGQQCERAAAARVLGRSVASTQQRAAQSYRCYTRKDRWRSKSEAPSRRCTPLQAAGWRTLGKTRTWTCAAGAALEGRVISWLTRQRAGGPACSRDTTGAPRITPRSPPRKVAWELRGWRCLLRLTWRPPSACAGACRGCARGQSKRRGAQRLAHASCTSAAASPRSGTAGVRCSTPGCAARYRRRSATRLASPQWATAAPKCSLSRRMSGCGQHSVTRCYANSCAAPPGVPAARAAA